MPLPLRLVSCLAAAAAASIVGVTARFVIAQPQGAYREVTYLSWWAFLLWVPAAVVVFAAVWVIARKRSGGVLAVSVSSLVAAALLLILVQYDPIQSWLLPPITYK